MSRYAEDMTCGLNTPLALNDYCSEKYKVYTHGVVCEHDRWRAYLTTHGAVARTCWSQMSLGNRGVSRRQKATVSTVNTHQTVKTHHWVLRVDLRLPVPASACSKVYVGFPKTSRGAYFIAGDFLLPRTRHYGRLGCLLTS